MVSLVIATFNHARLLGDALDSALAQTLRGVEIVVVDDGSTDETPAILAEYAGRLPYLRVVRRTDRGGRQVGPGVVEAFYAGLETARMEDFDYLCKLDMDLDLPVRYFELLMQRMESDPRIGTTSGKPWFVHPQRGTLVPEVCGDEMSVGMTKFYRRTCFEQIGGFVPALMWDGIDCHRCRMLGWKARSFDEPELRFVHLRPMGSSDGGWLRGRIRHGRGQYFMGTGPLYMAASALFRTLHPPRVVGAAAIGWGWLAALLERAPRYEDREFRRFLREYQFDCLLLGKRRATARADVRQAPRWCGRAQNDGQPLQTGGSL